MLFRSMAPLVPMRDVGVDLLRSAAYARRVRDFESPLAGFLQAFPVVREVTGLGLKEAKDVVDGAPKVVKEAASKQDADDIKAKLEAEGAKVTLK